MIETPPAQLTGVEFLPRVDALVSLQVRLREEGFGAESTLERFDPGVDVSVLLA